MKTAPELKRQWWDSAGWPVKIGDRVRVILRCEPIEGEVTGESDDGYLLIGNDDAVSWDFAHGDGGLKMLKC